MSSLLSLSKLSEIQSFCAKKEMTLVMFSSPGGQPCNILHPIIEKVALKYPESIGFLYIESNDDNSDAFNFYNISGVPTMILFLGTDPIAFQNGFKSEVAVIDWLTERLIGHGV
jgi:thiol-disulfide isomerase/thioredoxin